MKDWRLLTAKLCAENVYMYVEVMEEYGNDKKKTDKKRRLQFRRSLSVCAFIKSNPFY